MVRSSLFEGATSLKKRLLLVLLLAASLVALVLVARPVIKRTTQGKYKDFPVAIQIIGLVNRKFIQPVSLSDLIRSYMKHGKIQKTLAQLNDPYTRYLSPVEFRELKSQTEGVFGGIGVYLDYAKGVLTVMRPMKGSPAERAGLIQGDRIVAVDGRQTKDRTLEQVIAWIKGKVGTKVVITIERGDQEHPVRKDYDLIRAVIKVPTVELEVRQDSVIGKIAYINLAHFAETTAGDLESALNEAERAGVGGVILDLRYNPGGLLTSAVAVASKFLPGNGRVVRIEQRGYPGEDFPAYPNSHPKLPLVVLVNEWSASASEIVAGALKDREAGVLVGNTTFGKGVVQDVIPLTNGGALTLTVAEYLTAGGHSIHKKGIRPHVLMPTPAKVEESMKKGDLKPLKDFDQQLQEQAVKTLRQEYLGLQDKRAS
jgi:carboxyl-terminal processing protease